MPKQRRQNIGRCTRQSCRKIYERNSESQEQREQRLELNRARNTQSRANETINASRRESHESNLSLFNRIAFKYNHQIDYSSHPFVVIGPMDKVCTHCNALKFKSETPGMCCANGKVKLPELNYPPEPLSTLLSGVTPESKHFLANIRKYNACFQMTSFGASNIIHDNFMPTFKIQGQIYHRAGSLLPLPDSNHKYLPILLILGHPWSCR